MRPGEQFEISCYKYLKKFYTTKEIDFQHEGGMDSTRSDIAVIKKGKIDFYIEAKDSLSQSGQFVLLPDNNEEVFVFSRRNHSKQNEMTDIIINYMNSDFQRFNDAGTAGESIDINTDVFANWIIEHYKEKNVKYVISYDRDYVIFPICKFGKYFKIAANYRIKKSGSSKPAKRDINDVKKMIKNHYKTAKFSEKENKIFVDISETVNENRFTLGNYTYFLSKRNSGDYEIRKLSNTYNMNVIFSIKLIKVQDKNDLEKFKADLQRDCSSQNLT